MSDCCDLAYRLYFDVYCIFFACFFLYTHLVMNKVAHNAGYATALHDRATDTRDMSRKLSEVYTRSF